MDSTQVANNLRIMIIDDNDEIHQDFIKILKSTSLAKATKLKEISSELFGETPKKTLPNTLPDFQIDSTSQGQEGYEAIRAALNEGHPYALAFVDIRMPPGWDGIETIKQIWAVDPDIQIVICTAYSDYTWEKIIEHLGERDNLLILKKPFDQAAVRQLSLALVKKWQLQRDAHEYTKRLKDSLEEKTQSLENSMQDIIFQATHDLLTRLPKKQLLIHNIIQEIVQSTNDTSFAILFFDLDRFKLINDSFNHVVGDMLLTFVTERLKVNLPPDTMLARIGSDEFVAVISGYKSRRNIEDIAANIIEQFNQPFQIAEQNMIVTLSIGISFFPEQGIIAQELIRSANMAVDHAKKLGGNQVQYFQPALNQPSRNRLELINALHNAVKNKEFILYYQPQYCLKTNKIVSAEVLIRWLHPQKGFMLPSEFISIAEDSGIISDISKWVLRGACEQNKLWQDTQLSPIKLAVNISARDFRHTNFVEMVKTILTEIQINPQYLELEITENVIVNSAEAIVKINQLRHLGMTIAVDDFGKGYSSLSYLHMFPLDRLKIDRSFIKNIGINKNDEVILQTIIAMAHDLHLEMVAEGVETQAQVDFLKMKGCEIVQGYYYSKPMPKDELQRLLLSNNKK